MPERISPIEQRTGLGRAASERIATTAGRLIRRLTGAPEHHREPATEAVTALGRFVAANVDLSRVDFVEVRSTDPLEAVMSRPQAEIREHLHRDPDHYRPEPQAMLSLHGKNYAAWQQDIRDNFMCRFGVFNLDGGGRMVQAVPYEWERPTYRHEFVAMRATLAELFDGSPSVEELEKQARINLGIIQPDGSFAPLRPFNETAFGTNLLPILDAISTPTGNILEDHGLDFQLRRGQIRQYGS